MLAAASGSLIFRRVLVHDWGGSERLFNIHKGNSSVIRAPVTGVYLEFCTRAAYWRIFYLTY